MKTTKNKARTAVRRKFAKSATASERVKPAYSENAIDLMFHVYRINRDNPWLDWKESLFDETTQIINDFVQGISVKLPAKQAKSWLQHVGELLKRPFRNQQDVRQFCYWGYQGHNSDFIAGLNDLAKRLISGQDPLHDASKADLAKPEAAAYLFNALGLKQRWTLQLLTPKQQKQLEARMRPISNAPQRPSRQRPGYTSPSREGKVMVRTYLDAAEKKQLRALAQSTKLSIENLLAIVARDAIVRGESDASFKARLEQAGRDAEAIRQIAALAAREAVKNVRNGMRNDTRPMPRQPPSKSTPG